MAQLIRIAVAWLALAILGFSAGPATAEVSAVPSPGASGKGSGPTAALGGPQEWTEIADVGERVEVLRYLAAQARANYEKIRTWRATYRLRHRGPVPADALQAPAGLAPKQPAPAAVVCERDLVVDFVVDQSQDALFRDARPVSMEFRDAKTGQPVKLPWLSVPGGRAVLTRDTYLEFDPNRLVTLPELVERGWRRAIPVAYRKSQEAVPDWYGASSDPRKLFGYTSAFPIWQDLETDIRVFGGQHGATMKSHWETNCRIRRGQTPGGMWFQREFVSELPSGEAFIARSTFSPMENHLPIEWIALRGRAGANGQMEVEKRVRWKYTHVSGVYVPARFQEEKRDGYEWEYELVSCQINEPVDPA